MSRMSLGAWVWSCFSGCGVGEGVCAAESGGAVSPRGPSDVSFESGMVVVIVVGSVGISASAGPSYRASVVLAVGGSFLWSVGVGMLVCMAASRSCSYASASNRNII